MTGITIQHDEIVRWTSARGGKPVMRGESVELPAISFDQNQGTFEVSWDHWLSAFDRAELAFIYQDATHEGTLSQFWRVVPRFEGSAKHSKN